jgi:hypothetical protein
MAKIAITHRREKEGVGMLATRVVIGGSLTTHLATGVVWLPLNRLLGVAEPPPLAIGVVQPPQ